MGFKFTWIIIILNLFLVLFNSIVPNQYFSSLNIQQPQISKYIINLEMPTLVCSMDSLENILACIAIPFLAIFQMIIFISNLLLFIGLTAGYLMDLIIANTYLTFNYIPFPFNILISGIYSFILFFAIIEILMFIKSFVPLLGGSNEE